MVGLGRGSTHIYVYTKYVYTGCVGSQYAGLVSFFGQAKISRGEPTTPRRPPAGEGGFKGSYLYILVDRLPYRKQWNPSKRAWWYRRKPQTPQHYNTWSVLRRQEWWSVSYLVLKPNCDVYSIRRKYQGWIPLPSGNPARFLNQHSNTGGTEVIPVYALHQGPALWNGLFNTTWLPGIYCSIYEQLWIQYVVYTSYICACHTYHIPWLLACFTACTRHRSCTRKATDFGKISLVAVSFENAECGFQDITIKNNNICSWILCVFSHVCVRRKQIFIRETYIPLVVIGRINITTLLANGLLWQHAVTTPRNHQTSLLRPAAKHHD